MIKQYLEVGKIVSTHALRGEVRVEPWCDSPEFLCAFKTLYFDERGEKSVRVLSSRPHSRVVIMKLEGINSVEQAQALRGRVLYIRRADARLSPGQYFISELEGCKAVDADDEKKLYGTVSRVDNLPANDVWHIMDDEGIEYLIPAIPSVIIDVDVEAGIVRLRPLKGIFNDED